MVYLRKLLGSLIDLYKDSQLVKVSSKNLVQVIVKLVVGVLNIKISAVFLGTSGVALLSQFNNVIQFFTNIANGGLMNGVTKLTAFYECSLKRRRLVVYNAFLITLVLSFVLSILFVLFNNEIATTFLYDDKYTPIVKASGVLVFSLAINNLLFAFVNGLQAYNKYVYLNVAASLISALVIIPAIVLYGIEGGLWGQYIAAFIITIFTLLSVYKYLPSFKNIVFSKLISSRLMKFGIMLLVASSINPLMRIVTRNVIVEYCSLHQAGWWDGINKISNTYVSVVLSSLGLYFLPKISKTTCAKKINSEIKHSLLLVIPIVAGGSVLIYFLKDTIILLLFTDDFKGMSDLFLFQCIGDMMKIVNWFFAITIMIKEQVKQYIFAELVSALIIIANAYLIIPYFGIVGSSMAYAINKVVYFVFVFVIYKRMLVLNRCK